MTDSYDCIIVGLPSQLRDAVLSKDSSLAVPESDANREYFSAQHTQMVAQGTDPWSSKETPNEKLLHIIREVGQHREQPRIKLGHTALKRASAYVGIYPYVCLLVLIHS